MSYVLNNPEALYRRFELMQARLKQLNVLFSNPGIEITEAELVDWINSADMAHNEIVTLITDAVREVHLGAKN